MAAYGLLDEFAGIHQMLRTEMLGGPPAAFLEFNSEKITAVAENAVSHRADQLAIPVGHGDASPRRDPRLCLKAYAGKRDILQICYMPLLTPRRVLPNGLDQVSAK